MKSYAQKTTMPDEWMNERRREGGTESGKERFVNVQVQVQVQVQFYFISI